MGTKRYFLLFLLSLIFGVYLKKKLLILLRYILILDLHCVNAYMYLEYVNVLCVFNIYYQI